MATCMPLRIFSQSALAAMIIISMLTAPTVVLGASEDDDEQGTSEYSLAKQAINDGDYDVAIKTLTGLREEKPNNADILNLLGYVYRKTGNFDRARGYYLQALAAEPEHRGANAYMGELYLETGELEKAEERLAVLDSDCWLGCSEYTELKESVEKYKTEQGIQ